MARKTDINGYMGSGSGNLAALWDKAGKPEVAKSLRDNRAAVNAATGGATGAARSLAVLQMWAAGGAK